jgi:hypothetical protein
VLLFNMGPEILCGNNLYFEKYANFVRVISLQNKAAQKTAILKNMITQLPHSQR